MATQQELTLAGNRTISNSTCSGTALDLGATVTSWQPHGRPEVLFLSREALVGAGDEIHGGIPICAPWFAKGRDDVAVPRPHGLVRWVPWNLSEDLSTENSSTLVWELSGHETAHLPGAQNYPADIWYRHEVRFADTLILKLTIGSPSTSFILDEAFHTYFSISEIRDVVIEGLGDTRYRDYTDGGTWHDSVERLHITGRVDRIYDGKQDVSITDARQIVTLRTSGASNTVVWNPGPEGAQSLTGWAGDEWRSMVCVEVGNVQHNAVTVPAGGSHTMGLEISVRPLP